MSSLRLEFVGSRFKTNGVVLSKTRFALCNSSAHPSTPTALRAPAQGCEARATLGDTVDDCFQPQRGCGAGAWRAKGRNPVGVVLVLGVLPKVAPQMAQPWADGRNPVGILRLGHGLNEGAK